MAFRHRLAAALAFSDSLTPISISGPSLIDDLQTWRPYTSARGTLSIEKVVTRGEKEKKIEGHSP